MRKHRLQVHRLFESTGSAIQKFMVAPIVEFLRLHPSRR